MWRAEHVLKMKARSAVEQIMFVMKRVHQCCQKSCQSAIYISFRHLIGVCCLLSDSMEFLYYEYFAQIHSDHSYNLNTSSSCGAWDSRCGVGNGLAVKQTLIVLQFRGSGTGLTSSSGSVLDLGSLLEILFLEISDLFSVEITSCCTESETVTV